MYMCIFNRFIILAGIVLASGCASYHNHVNPMERKIAASHLVYGPSATQSRQSEMIAAGIGALRDSALADYQDRLESDLRNSIKDTGIMLRRNANVVHLMMPAGLTFDAMSAELRPQFYPVLDILAEILQTHQQTMIEVIGYGDDDDAGNQRLPVLRAAEISTYLVARNLHHQRFEVVGLKRRHHAVEGNTVRVYAAQAEIRLLPLQRTVSMQRGRRETAPRKSPDFLEL